MLLLVEELLDVLASLDVEELCVENAVLVLLSLWLSV